jgi:hypothetical protein
MKDYYTILSINSTILDSDIQPAYVEKIRQFRNLPFLTSKMILEIKNIKEAFYVLSYYRLQYDKKLRNEDSSTEICNRLFINLYS